MKFSTFEDLERVKADRKPGFLDACLKRGRPKANGVEWEDAVHAQLRAEFSITRAERRKLGLGDVVGKVATPIARALKLDCIDPATKELKPESPCQKRKEWLNNLTGGK